MIDHLSKDCPQGNMGGGARPRIQHDIIKGPLSFVPNLIFDAGNQITSNDPLPSWDPIPDPNQSSGGDALW